MYIFMWFAVHYEDYLRPIFMSKKGNQSFYKNVEIKNAKSKPNIGK